VNSVCVVLGWFGHGDWWLDEYSVSGSFTERLSPRLTMDTQLNAATNTTG